MCFASLAKLNGYLISIYMFVNSVGAAVEYKYLAGLQCTYPFDQHVAGYQLFLFLYTSVVSMLLCRISRRDFFSSQKRKTAHSSSYVRVLFCRDEEKDQDLGRLK